MSHTPGPWFQSSTVLVCSGDAEVIANCTPLVDVPALSIPLNQVDANARLIAAAPDLLAALENLVQACIADGWADRNYWADKASTAIKKAKGE